MPLLAATREREGDEATRRLVDAVATVLVWALLVTCVVGVVGAPVLVWLMASGLAASFDAAVRDDALDVPLHRLHVAGGAVGRHPQHLEALRRAGGHAGAAEPVRDRRRLVGRAAGSQR